MKEHIKVAFDESQQRFGANKIAAVLSAQGISTSAKYVRDLMQEMGLQSITQYSKRDYTQRPHSTLNYKTPDQFEAMYKSKQKSAD